MKFENYATLPFRLSLLQNTFDCWLYCLPSFLQIRVTSVFWGLVLRVMVETFFQKHWQKAVGLCQRQNALDCPLYLSNALTADALFGF